MRFPRPAAIPRIFALKSVLAGLVVLCIAPAVMVAGWLVYRDYQRQSERLYESTVLTARRIASDLDGQVSDIRAALRLLAASGELAQGDLAAFHERASNALVPQDGIHFVLLDAHDRQLVDTLGPYGSTMPAAGLPSAVVDAARSQPLVVSGLIAASPGRAPEVAICVAASGQGAVGNHVICAGVRPERLNRTLARQRLAPGWVTVALDRQGQILARFPDARGQFVGTLAVPALVAAVKAGRDVALDTITKDGVDVLTGFSPSALSGWSVAAGAPRSLLVADLSRSLAWVSGACALALAAAVVLALRLARRIGAAVEGLVGPALAIGSGEAVTLPQSNIREIAALGAAIAEAAQRLTQAKHLAHHDPLTGLCNRLLLDQLAAQRLSVSKRTDVPLALLMIDLDGFKAVNDRHGHATGDLVLRTAAARITDCVRGSDIRARLGGDEFVVLLEATSANAGLVAAKLVDALSAPYPDVIPEVAASVGVAIAPQDGTLLDELLASADKAMYVAKRRGKGQVAFCGE